MTFEELLLSALSKADEEPGDEIIDMVAEDSVNEGYMRVATIVDPLVKVDNIVYDGSGYAVPKDFHSLVELRLPNFTTLSAKDFSLIGETIVVTNKDYRKENQEFNFTYVYFPPKLVNPKDKPLTRSQFDYQIVLYGAYNIALYKKRYDMASMIWEEYMRTGEDVE